MTGTQTMVRTQMTVNEASFFLAQGQDLPALKARIEDAVRAGGGFVGLVVVGNREVSVLFTPVTQVAFSIETVQYDARDTGDSDVPFGGFFDE